MFFQFYFLLYLAKTIIRHLNNFLLVYFQPLSSPPFQSCKLVILDHFNPLPSVLLHKIVELVRLRSCTSWNSYSSVASLPDWLFRTAGRVLLALIQFSFPFPSVATLSHSLSKPPALCTFQVHNEPHFTGKSETLNCELKLISIPQLISLSPVCEPKVTIFLFKEDALADSQFHLFLFL